MNKADIEALLAPYSDLHLECDGMTKLASHLLTKHNVSHYIGEGTIQYQSHKVYHYWIEVVQVNVDFESTNLFVDYRARMWMGNCPDVPHGVFDPAEYPLVTNFLFL